MTRYDFALIVAAQLGFDKSLIGAARTVEFKWFEKRPRDSSLSYEKTKSVLSTRFYDTGLTLKMFREEGGNR